MQIDDEDKWNDADRLCAVTTARRVCGDKSADRLVRDFGGTRIYFPITVTPFHPLARSMGRKAAQKLCDELYGCAVEIPVGEIGMPHMRRRIVKVGILSGVTCARIAMVAMCTERQVYNIAKSLRVKGELPLTQRAANA